MMWQLIITGIAVLVLVIGYVLCRLKQANDEINALLKTNETLQAEKAVAQTQVKHFETRKRHDETSRNIDRTTLIDRLHKQGDLRD